MTRKNESMTREGAGALADLAIFLLIFIASIAAFSIVGQFVPFGPLVSIPLGVLAAAVIFFGSLYGYYVVYLGD